MESMKKVSIQLKPCLGDNMAIIYPDDVFTESRMLDMWNEEWEDTYPKRLPRKDRTTLPTDLSVDNAMYYIALDEDKIVGYCGWVDKGTYYVTAGIYIIPEYQGKNIATKLMEKRRKKTSSKPVIASLNNENLPKGSWREAWARRGWIFNPTPEQIPKGIPLEIVEKEKEGWGAELVAVYSPDAMNKAWIIIKAMSDKEILMCMGDL